ncbi:MAG: PDZ domain-containing protein [Bacteroidales bacterium]|nr:PDZ domain-containing protein [Bacteroidales bacterium]
MKEYKYSSKIIITPLLFALAIVIGILIGRFYKLNKPDNMFYIYPRADKLTNVINYIEKDYVDPVSSHELIENTIPKILSELDPHSQYVPAEEINEVNEPLEGNFSGIGIQFNMLNDTLIVLKTITNGPSEKIGILAGDRILVVNNDTVAGKKIQSDSIVSLLKGPKGTIVTVGVQRKNVSDLLYFDITRDNIPLYSMDIAYMVRPGIGFIKLNKFSRTTYEEFSDGVIKLLGEGMTKLILDLRNNGGGYLDAAVKIADQFLENGQLIVYTEGNSLKRQNYTATKGGICKGLDVIILLDEGSASASEILAGAIQDNDRGLIVGRRSFGKGLVQEQKMFSDGSAIRLTIARYYTPTGRCIQKPYENGNEEEYYLDLSNRFLHGEMAHKDSIKFDDSLKYLTPGGKVVYGGGGIMPDIFVPIDTTSFTDYLADIRNRGLIYRFALEFTDQHRENLEKISSLDEFYYYLNSRKTLQQFIEFAKNNNVPPNKEQITTSEFVMKTQLYAYIIRNIFDNKGFYPVIEKIDNTLLKAIDIISSEEMMARE